MATAKATKSAPAPKSKASGGFTAEERAAMRDRVKEMKAEARRGTDRAEGEREVVERIARMPEPDHGLAKRIHAIVTTAAPELMPRLWYGMPAYAKDGNVVCHFQDAAKFKSRYATIGFSDKAKLDEGRMWPVAFALTELTAADEAKITALVKKAAR